MTVSTQVTKVIYSGNGSTTNFPITFPYINQEDIGVYLTDLDGLVTKLLPSQFEFNEVESKIVYPKTEVPALPPLPSGYKLTVARETLVTQDVDLVNQGPFTAQGIEESFDKQVMLIQEINEKVTRCIQYPIDESPSQSDTSGFLAVVNEAKADALSAASAASTSATNASASASSASTSATSASASASSASASAASASSSASSATTTLAQVQSVYSNFVSNPSIAAQFNPMSTNQTLTASSGNSFLVNPNSDTRTITLPNATTLSNGTAILFYNMSFIYSVAILDADGVFLFSLLPVED